MQIIVRSRILARSLSDLLAKAREANEIKMITLQKQGFAVTPLYFERDPAGFQISLGNFRVDREFIPEKNDVNTEKDKELKYSSWGRLPKEVVSDKTEYFLECREYGPSRNSNKVFCTIKGEELTDDFELGLDHMSYLCQDQVVEAVISNSDYLTLRRSWIEFYPAKESVKVCKELIWKGPLAVYPKADEKKYAKYYPTILRCVLNLQERSVPVAAPAMAVRI